MLVGGAIWGNNYVNWNNGYVNHYNGGDWGYGGNNNNNNNNNCKNAATEDPTTTSIPATSPSTTTTATGSMAAPAQTASPGNPTSSGARPRLVSSARPARRPRAADAATAPVPGLAGRRPSRRPPRYSSSFSVGAVA